MDLSRAKTLSDSEQFIGPETCFKLCAGPGAGKTTFLINHVNNVIANSSRLTLGKKVACITYTNIGVETIVKRLDNALAEVEVSTIHSFLYKQVVKPYLWVIEEDFEIPIADIDGHEEIIPTFSILSEWKNNTSQKYINDLNALKTELMGLKWIINDSGEIELQRKYPYKNPLKIKNDSLFEYKEICWKNAKINHDDILFLSYKILKKNERILDIIRAKFPYIFIDEFQDTSPIQSEIIKMIGEKETVIGIIGDYGQSIFSFLGADVQKFTEFDLNNMKLYKIEDNYRSTNEIIKILNHIRNETNFKQNSPDNKTGEKPKILIGDFFAAYSQSINYSNDNPVYTLSYRNETANTMKFGLEYSFVVEDFKNLFFNDSDYHRGLLITHIIPAIEYAKENKIKESLKFMKRAYRKYDFEDKDALDNLIRLLNNYDQFKEISIKEFYNEFIYGNYGVASKITSGRAKTYYENLMYYQVAATVRVNDDNVTLHRTIHSSKGDQFCNVLTILPSEDDLDFIINPNIQNEVHRVYYVSLSRAIQKLFINVPTLSDDKKTELITLGLN